MADSKARIEKDSKHLSEKTDTKPAKQKVSKHALKDPEKENIKNPDKTMKSSGKEAPYYLRGQKLIAGDEKNKNDFHRSAEKAQKTGVITKNITKKPTKKSFIEDLFGEDSDFNTNADANNPQKRDPPAEEKKPKPKHSSADSSTSSSKYKELSDSTKSSSSSSKHLEEKKPKPKHSSADSLTSSSKYKQLSDSTKSSSSSSKHLEEKKPKPKHSSADSSASSSKYKELSDSTKSSSSSSKHLEEKKPKPKHSSADSSASSSKYEELSDSTKSSSSSSKHLDDEFPKIKKPKQIESLTLKSMTLPDLLKTFDDFKPILDEVFRTEHHKYNIQGYNGVNNFVTSDLMSSDNELEMLRKLGDYYKCGETEDYIDLFVNAMGPEWILNIIMRKHSLSRDKAIQQLKEQDLKATLSDNTVFRMRFK